MNTFDTNLSLRLDYMTSWCSKVQSDFGKINEAYVWFFFDDNLDINIDETKTSNICEHICKN